MGTEDTTAQVTPAEFTRSINRFAQDKGALVIIASAESLEYEEDGSTLKAVVAKKDDGESVTIPATEVILAAGPWTARVAQRLLGKDAGTALDIEPRSLLRLEICSAQPTYIYAFQWLLNICHLQTFDPNHRPCPLHLPRSPLRCLGLPRNLSPNRRNNLHVRRPHRSSPLSAFARKSDRCYPIASRSEEPDRAITLHIGEVQRCKG